jgi:hypothetical protein
MVTCFALLTTTGCVPIQRNGAKYYVILGAGVIRVTQTNQVTVVKADSLGLYAGDGRMNFGYSSIYSARVPTNANVLLEVTK